MMSNNQGFLLSGESQPIDSSLLRESVIKTFRKSISSSTWLVHRHGRVDIDL